MIVLAVLFAVYVGAYFALLDTPSGSPQSWLGPRFKIEGETPHAVFAPLAWLDLQIRPDYWKARAHLSPF
jgi:hypothetical protein